MTVLYHKAVKTDEAMWPHGGVAGSVYARGTAMRDSPFKSDRVSIAPLTQWLVCRPSKPRRRVRVSHGAQDHIHLITGSVIL